MSFTIVWPLVSYLVCGGVAGMLLWTVRLGVRARAAALMGLLLCASKFTCFAAFGGDPFVPELPEALILVWNTAHAGLFLALFLLPPALLVRWAVRRFAGRDCPRWLWLVLLPLLAWGLAVRGIWNGRKAPEVVEETLVFENLPAELDGYRILQISDIHASPAARRARTEAIVRRANECAPDLICLTGDFADGQSARQFRNIEPIRDLKAKDGVLAVTGNHEYYFDASSWLARYWSMETVRFLDNEWVAPRPGLVVAGVSDPGCLKVGLAAPDPDRAFAGAPEGAFRILLQHRPFVDYGELSGRMPTSAWDLQLSGHTHGGIFPPMVPVVGAFNRGYCRGTYEGVRSWHDVLHVSNGVGLWAGFPIRLCNDASMTLITLRRK